MPDIKPVVATWISIISFAAECLAGHSAAKENYQIYFVKNSFGKPSHTFIDNLLDWLLKGKLVPYLKKRDIIKEERVFLTLNETTFDN